MGNGQDLIREVKLALNALPALQRLHRSQSLLHGFLTLFIKGDMERIKIRSAAMNASCKELTINLYGNKKHTLTYFGLDVLSANRKSKDFIIPEKAGLYILVDQVGSIVYLGSTNNLNRRIQEHVWLKKKQFVYASWVSTPDLTEEVLTGFEYKILAVLKQSGVAPKYNKVFL